MLDIYPHKYRHGVSGNGKSFKRYFSTSTPLFTTIKGGPIHPGPKN